MLGGIEAVELKLSEILVDNDSFRFDSEYFKKKYLKSFNILNNYSLNKLSFVSNKIIVGYVGSMVNEYIDNGIILLQTKNIDEIFINEKDYIKINSSFHNKLKKSQIKYKDILIARSGSFGKASIYLEEVIINTSDIIIIEANEKLINSFYLTTFLNTSYGKNQLIRFASGGVQGHVNLTILENLHIPNLNNTFQQQIEILVKFSYQKLKNSKTLYKQSEQLLLKELGLLDFKPSKENISIKSFSNSFGDSGRLDSEYYQRKYDDLIDKFEKFDNIKLNELVTYSISSGATPKAGGDDYTDKDNGIPFIRAVNVINSKVEFDNILFVKDYIHNKKLKKTQLKENDVLFSIAGTVGRCGISYYKKEANINQAVAILRFDDDVIRRLYLILFFNSKIGKLYITKYSRQGLQTNLNLDEVGNLSIPILDYTIQTQIEEKVKESFKLKEESKELLELAKKAVEVAIEEGEEVAINLIEKGEI